MLSQRKFEAVRIAGILTYRERDCFVAVETAGEPVVDSLLAMTR